MILARQVFEKLMPNLVTGLLLCHILHMKQGWLLTALLVHQTAAGHEHLI